MPSLVSIEACAVENNGPAARAPASVVIVAAFFWQPAKMSAMSAMAVIPAFRTGRFGIIWPSDTR
jgi:hypothetical protein